MSMDGIEESGESSTRDVAVQMVQALIEMPTSAAGKWVNLITTLCAHNARQNVPSSGVPNNTQPESLPTWA